MSVVRSVSFHPLLKEGKYKAVWDGDSIQIFLSASEATRLIMVDQISEERIRCEVEVLKSGRIEILL